MASLSSFLHITTPDFPSLASCLSELNPGSVFCSLLESWGFFGLHAKKKIMTYCYLHPATCTLIISISPPSEFSDCLTVPSQDLMHRQSPHALISSGKYLERDYEDMVAAIPFIAPGLSYLDLAESLQCLVAAWEFK